ncbi:MAG: TIGR02391 family protein [Clostridiaceae bacterium]|nr:TIGR02391 family protein [Clostridiaceae bacterium]
MNLEKETFTSSALEQISKIIGDRYTGSEITSFFEKCGFPEYVHDGATKWRFVKRVLHQIQNSTYGSYNIVKIIKILCSPEEFYTNAELHRDIINSVNEVIEFYGLRINTDGTITYLREKRSKPSEKDSEDAKLFASRTLHHEIVKHSKVLFVEGNYFHAVFESCKAFDKYVKEKSCIDKHGTDLMSAALSLKGPLKLNKQITETEKNEQEGLMHLCMGLMRAIRNPESHEPKLDWNINREDALDILSLISFLYRRIDKTIYFDMTSTNSRGGKA